MGILYYSLSLLASLEQFITKYIHSHSNKDIMFTVKLKCYKKIQLVSNARGNHSEKVCVSLPRILLSLDKHAHLWLFIQQKQSDLSAMDCIQPYHVLFNCCVVLQSTCHGHLGFQVSTHYDAMNSLAYTSWCTSVSIQITQFPRN